MGGFAPPAGPGPPPTPWPPSTPEGSSKHQSGSSSSSSSVSLYSCSTGIAICMERSVSSGAKSGQWTSASEGATARAQRRGRNDEGGMQRREAVLCCLVFHWPVLTVVSCSEQVRQRHHGRHLRTPQTLTDSQRLSRTLHMHTLIIVHTGTREELLCTYPE